MAFEALTSARSICECGSNVFIFCMCTVTIIEVVSERSVSWSM